MVTLLLSHHTSSIALSVISRLYPPWVCTGGFSLYNLNLLVYHKFGFNTEVSH
jgi:hypothetical protein